MSTVDATGSLASTITDTELMARTPSLPLDQAIAGLRPYFLRVRGAEPTVYVNGLPFGPLSSLSSIATPSVKTIRLYQGPAATQAFGMRHRGAVLHVTLRSAADPE